ncbi:dethiobiotin synthetase [Hydrogenivirga caldilitoris]|uniref:ATP-dependent dethiobiotin synthetase BioD n=1 Tax=Hydrogenivirga caldilitoris TaxID=246264 RepID=A0A497XNH5_9AQUI|nr:dethiobiotin synthase [Hydrogenivirga caldilitoris]RLJ70418.1 dethiobiotin synthetase [Hydrogenivirga caldilitoris]
MTAILVTGTDTGVGKTFITYNIARALKEKGIRVGCFKPVETYVRDIPEDGKLLASATGQSVDEVVPVRFLLPLAPYSAEIEEGKKFSLKELRERFEDLKRKYEVLLVEGAGGIAVPIKENYTYGNLAKDWGVPVLVVGRAGLGTLNHTYLTWYYAKSLSLEVIGIVLNGFEGTDVSEKTNPRVVYEMTGLKPVCIRRSKGTLVSEEEKNLLLELIGF